MKSCQEMARRLLAAAADETLSDAALALQVQRAGRAGFKLGLSEHVCGWRGRALRSVQPDLDVRCDRELLLKKLSLATWTTRYLGFYQARRRPRWTFTVHRTALRPEIARLLAAAGIALEPPTDYAAFVGAPWRVTLRVDPARDAA